MNGYVDVNGIAHSDLDKVTPGESQAWVHLRLAGVYAKLAETGEYAEGNDRTIVGENDRGQIMAPKPGTDTWWEMFDVTKPEHRAAAAESARRGAIAFLDLEYEGDPE